MNLIEELYYGAVCPSTKIKIQSPAYHKAMSIIHYRDVGLLDRVSDPASSETEIPA